MPCFRTRLKPKSDILANFCFFGFRLFLKVAVLITYSPQNGVILLVTAFLISPMGLPLAAIWLLGKVQSLKFAIQDLVYG